MGDNSSDSSRSTAADPLPEIDFVGRIIEGRYHVRARVARGGFATVYLATDRRLGRDVVVKVMHPYLAEGKAGAQFVPRFRREARNAAKLAHPGTVTIIDQGVEDNLPYLITEYVPGSSVRRELRIFGTMPLGKTLGILDQVLATVAAAHRKGLVHRDLKPENLLIDRDGLIKVADFGLARAVNEVTSDITGAIVGTASYLAPEVFLGSESDPRTDIYAIGIMGYEMLTGHLPFDSTDPIDVAIHHVKDDIPPATDDLDWLPSDVSDLLVHFAARDPANRPRDGVHALAELRRVRRELDSEHPELLSRRNIPPDDFEEPETGEIQAVPAPDGDVGTEEPVENPTLPSLGNETLNLDRIPTSVFTPAHGVPVVSDDAGSRVFAADSPRALVAMDETSNSANRTRRTGLPILITTTADTGPLTAAEQPEQPVRQVAAASAIPPGSSPDSEVSLVPPPPPPRRRLTRKHFALIALSAVLAGAGVWGASWWQATGAGEWTTVPENLFGMPEQQAVRQLTNRRLTAETVQQYSQDVPPGLVIQARPEMGTPIQRHETVELIVSGETRLVTIPSNLIGQRVGDVERALRAADVRFNNPIREYSDTAPTGEVLALSHEEGAVIPIQTVIDVIVSRGPAPVTVSQQIGRERAEAINALAHLGLQIAFAPDAASATVPRGYIMAQDPPAGTNMRRGDVVTLTISLGS